jgi:hypothetical protein
MPERTYRAVIFGGTVATGPKVPLAGSKVEPLPVQTAARSAQSNQSWHRRWRSGPLVEDAGLGGRQMQQCQWMHSASPQNVGLSHNLKLAVRGSLAGRGAVACRAI